MKKILGVMLLATLMAGCSSTTPMNKDTTLGDLLGIGPISLPAGYDGGQGAITKPAQGITAQSMIAECRDYYLMIQGTKGRYAPMTKQEEVTKLASGNYLVSVYVSNFRYNGNSETWDQSVCEYDKNGKQRSGRIYD